MSLILSTLEYASLIWENNSTSHSDQLEKIQKKSFDLYALNLIYQEPPHSRYEHILNILNFESLKTRKNNTHSNYFF